MGHTAEGYGSVLRAFKVNEEQKQQQKPYRASHCKAESGDANKMMGFWVRQHSRQELGDFMKGWIRGGFYRMDEVQQLKGSSVKGREKEER